MTRMTVPTAVVMVLTFTSAVRAQTQTPTVANLLAPQDRAVFGQIDFGGRVTTVDGDPARYQRYRDLRDGAFFEMPVYHREGDSWWVNMAVRNAGYRDQRYVVTGARPGRVKFRFLYDQTPTFISGETMTPYTPLPAGNGFYDQAGAALTLPDSIQAAIQGDVSLARPLIESLAGSFPSRIRRDSLGFDLTFDMSEIWQAKVKYLNTRKEGNIPWGASFGFNLPIEIPLPIDTRTNDFGSSLEWHNNAGMFRVGYEGSWFEQHVPSYTWDNPVRVTDRTYDRAYRDGDGTSIGRGTQWPSNSFYYVNLGGSYRFPSRTSLNGTLSLGQATQNQLLVPYTINTAIPGLNDVSSLDRVTADTKADISAATVNFVTRPSQSVNVTTRYRLSRYDNKTPPFERHEYVRFDQVAEEGGPPLFQGYTRNYLDVDVAYTGFGYTTLRVGYGYYGADFEERLFFGSNDHTLRASMDAVGNQYISFRSLYEHTQRRGDGFRADVLEEASEKLGMRHYDIADRDRNRVTLITNLMARSDLGVNVSLAVTNDTYLNREQPSEDRLGLHDHTSQTYGIGLDYVPRPSVAVGTSYNYDRYGGLSLARRTADDPNSNWTTDEKQRGHSVIAYADLPNLIEKTQVRVDYDYSNYNGMYVYATSPGYLPTPGAPGGIAQLPPLSSTEHRLTGDARYFIRRNVAIGFAYWYDKYTVSDFTLSPPGETFVSGIARPPIFEGQAPESPINGVVLNYFYRPYTSHTAWLRLTYLW